MQLRWYQLEAADAAMEWMRTTLEPGLIEAITGAGKSLIIAEIAKRLHSATGKRVLCLAPSAELVKQNRQKYISTGNRASMYSASAGRKCLRHPVVFGTPGTVKNGIGKLSSEFALVIIDEAHGITPTIRTIIDSMRERNKLLRVIGLTSTPFRTDTGYIYRVGMDGKSNGDETCRDPYFARLLYRVTYADLVGRFITPMVVAPINAEVYDTSKLRPNTHHKSADVDEAFVGQGRKTSAIVADIVDKSRHRQGVMIFAATVAHAREVMDSLPAGISAMITGDTPAAERSRIINRFGRREVKYLVNVSVLTTGFDAPHVDHIAIMRASESAGLILQVIGRGLRQSDGKRDCIVSDYAGNIEAHAPDGDIFSPRIRAGFTGAESTLMQCECEQCGGVNEFGARENSAGLKHDRFGYFVDLDGNRVDNIPAHYGRRCTQLLPVGGGAMAQCAYRWSCKTCDVCESDNDIAARRCGKCGNELIDPNEKLVIEFTQFKKDPTRVQCDAVLSWSIIPTTTKNGESGIRVDFVTEYRTFSAWYFPQRQGYHKMKFDRLMKASNELTVVPRSIKYVRQKDSKYFDVLDYNCEVDHVPNLQS